MSKLPRRSLLLLLLLGLLALVGVVLGQALPGAAAIEHALQRWAKEELGRDLRIDGAVGLRLWPPIGIGIRQASLANAPGFSARPFAEVDLLELYWRPWALLSGRVELASVRLQGLRISLERDRSGRLNWPGRLGATQVQPTATRPTFLPVAAAVAADGAPLAGEGRFLQIGAAEVVWEDQATGRSGRLTGVDLAMTAPAAGEPLTWWLAMSRVDLGIGVPTRLRAEGQLTLDAAAQSLLLSGVGLDLDGLAISGALRVTDLRGRPAMTGRLALDRLDLRGWLVRHDMMAAARLPEGALRSLAGEVALAADAEAVTLDPLQLQVDDARLTGTARFFFGDPLGVRFDLSVDRLDLDRYLPGVSQPDAAETPPKTAAAGAGGRGSDSFGWLSGDAGLIRAARAAAEAPAGPAPATVGLPANGIAAVAIPSAGLHRLDLDGGLRAGDLRAAGLRFGPSDLHATAKDGLLRLEQRADAFYTGRLVGGLTLDVREEPPRIGLVVQAQQAQVGPLLEDLRGDARLEGGGDLELDLAAVGTRLVEMRPTLTGQLAVALRDGAVRGLDLEGLIAVAKAALEGRGMTAPATGRGTAFTELRATGVVRDGVLTSDDLSGRSDHLTLTGEGRIDLVREQIDYWLRPVLVEPPDGQGLKALAGIPIPVHVTGPLDAPSWAVDLAPVLREAAQRRLDEQGDDLLEKLEDRLGVPGLGQGLRNLLGR